MKILVTGGAGFIGSHVCDAFLAGRHEVVALDNLSTGRRENLDPGVRLAVLDVRAPETAELIKRERPSVICHLAAQMDVRRSVADPRFDAEQNILGLLNVLEAARAAGVWKVIFSSTGGAVYGEQSVFPAPESHPLQPVSPYGVSKAAGELYLGYYREQFGIRSVALRYANVYGARQNAQGEAGVVAIFIDRLLRGLPCTIFGDGEQTRDFVHVEDVARANYLAFEHGFVGAANVGTGIETSVNRLYAMLAAAAESPLRARYGPRKDGEQLRSSIDPRLAREALEWEPAVALPAGLLRTVQWFASARGLPRADGVAAAETAAAAVPVPPPTRVPATRQRGEILRRIPRVDAAPSR